MNKKEELSLIDMYDLVFEDCVKCYLENFNENEDKLTLTDKEIKRIANKIVYKNEYVWEIINETIDMYIREILREREKVDE